jgi:hypothetical protein
MSALVMSGHGELKLLRVIRQPQTSIFVWDAT